MAPRKAPPPSVPTAPTKLVPGAWEAMVSDIIFGVSVQDAAIRHGVNPAALLAALHPASPLARHIKEQKANLRAFHRGNAGVHAEVAAYTLAELASSDAVEPKDRIAAAGRLLTHVEHRDTDDLDTRKADVEERLEVMAARLDALLGPHGPE